MKYHLQKTVNVESAQCTEQDKTSSQIPETPQITLLDDDEEEDDDDVPLAKLSRTAKQNERKGKNTKGPKSMSQPPTTEGSSSNSGRNRPARRVGKAIKHE